MNYLVVGGSGYLGSHLISQLIDRGNNVFIFDNLSGNVKNWDDERVTNIYGDITRYTDIVKLNNYPKFDGVFHLAAKKSVAESVLKPKLYEEVNILGTNNIVKYCVENDISKFVYTSSAAVYGQFDSDESISETNPTYPISPYGISKLNGEKVLEDASSRSFSGVSLRIFNIVGASKTSYFDNKGENVVPIMLRSLLTKTSFTIFGMNLGTKDGTCIRDYINAEDVAYAHIKAMDYLDLSSSGSYQVANICSGLGTSMLELVETLNSLSKEKLQWNFGEKRLSDPVSVIGDNQLAYNLFGWKPEKTLIQSVAESLAAMHFG